VVEKPGERKLLETQGQTGGYIKMDPKEVRRNSVDWNNVAENRDKCEYGKKLSGS
jgi:hypothetical protein